MGRDSARERKRESAREKEREQESEGARERERAEAITRGRDGERESTRARASEREREKERGWWAGAVHGVARGKASLIPNYPSSAERGVGGAFFWLALLLSFAPIFFGNNHNRNIGANNSEVTAQASFFLYYSQA